MITLSRLWLSVLLLASAAVNAGSYDARNRGPGDLLTGIYSITVSQTGANPVVHVQSNGSNYTGVKPGQSVTWQASSRGVCRGLKKIHRFDWWINDNTKKGPSSFHQQHVKLVEKKWITSRHSSTKFEASGMLSMPVHTALADHAVQACNNHLQSELAKGKTLAAILSVDHIIDANQIASPRMAGVVKMQCNKPSGGMNNEVSHAYQNIRVNYHCGAVTPTPAAPATMPKPAGLQAPSTPFQLEKPKVSVTPAQHQGSCPVNIEVEGTLKANKGQETVKYRWSHNGGMGPVASVKLNTSGWSTVKTTLKDIGKTPAGPGNSFVGQQQPVQPGTQLQAANSNIHNGHIELHVLPMAENDWAKAKKEKAVYTVACKDAIKARVVPSAPVKQSDLTYGPTLTVANVTGQWGSTLVVDASAFNESKRGDKCQLRFAYDVLNQGQGDAGSFLSRLSEGAAVLDQSQITSVASGKNHRVAGHLYLNDGSHILNVSVDDSNQVDESNESNNKNRIHVNVKNCTEASARRR